MFWQNAPSFVAVTLIGGLGMAAVRSLPWFTFALVESLGPVTVLWGLGGAILGGMLAAGWYVTLPTAGWHTGQPVDGKLAVTLGNVWWVLMGRPEPREGEGRKNQ
jgi:hypothetical protein